MRRTMACLTGILLGLLTFAPESVLAHSCKGSDLRPSMVPSDRLEVSARTNAMPFATGNHWRARKDGKTIHLIGTIHVDDPRLDDVHERLAPVIQSSELLLLEMTQKEQDDLKAALAERPELIFLQDESLAELMPEEAWQSLANEARERGIPPALASRFQPWYLSVLLSTPTCVTPANGSTPNGLDKRLMETALSAGTPTKALEPYDTLFTLFTDTSLQEQIDQIGLSLGIADQNENMLATLREAYFEENHGEAWQMSRWQIMNIQDEDPEHLENLFREMENDLLIARNKAWIPVILEASRAHNHISVAAGAAHLSGHAGVLTLLQAEGFNLQRMGF